MKPQMLAPIVLLAALAVGGYYLDRSRAEHRNLISGTFESQPSRLAPKTSGRVSQILVHEGEAVKAGQVLVRLTAPDTVLDAKAVAEQAKGSEAKSSEAQAGSRAEEIKRQIAAVAEAEAGLAKLRSGPLPQEIAIAESHLQSARAKYLELKRGSRPEQVQQAQAAANQAEAQLAIVRRGPNPEEQRQLEAKLAAAESDRRTASLEYDRMRFLGKEGAVAQRDVDAARNRFETASANREAASQAVNRALKGAPPEERRQAEAAYRQAIARLREVQHGSRAEEISAAAAEMRAQEENVALLRRGSRTEDIAAAQARLEAAQATLAQLREGNRPEEVAQARAAARAARAQAGSAKDKLQELVVRAPKDGVVERILVADGDLAGSAIPVVQFSDPSDIWLRVYVPEASLATVHPGGAAVLTIDGIPSSVDAVVESVATQGEFTPANLQTTEERGKQVFAVRLRLRRPDSRVKAGMAATVRRIG
ncbi:HlyD family secretion protein [Fimbriimonas ginsengisoli]|uniref:Secretion protein HlyD n=1 Tax=Fimbriimonas ginsengisoli Gsoil 348 TaxID=661478 RepID=A0A068NXB4_FIMGI|nr:HlyD family efflux transporter periplasmic adaptor subunit [Fimbriimonas ginsengisoli]AIE86274.1 Secretion protein HlyD [Fimbriimonas ginsengisoli Gsoil 348]